MRFAVLEWERKRTQCAQLYTYAPIKFANYWLRNHDIHDIRVAKRKRINEIIRWALLESTGRCVHLATPFVHAMMRKRYTLRKTTSVVRQTTTIRFTVQTSRLRSAVIDCGIVFI